MSKQVTSLVQVIFFCFSSCHALWARWDSLVVNFPRPIYFTVTMAAARKSMGVVYPVITSLIVQFWPVFNFYLSIINRDVCYCIWMTISITISLSLSFFFLSGPINREMRHLISSLQNHNHQLKGDVQRYKRKLRETQMEINKVLLMLVFVDSFMISHNHRIFSGNIQLQKYFLTHTHHTHTHLSPQNMDWITFVNLIVSINLHFNFYIENYPVLFYIWFNFCSVYYPNTIARLTWKT